MRKRKAIYFYCMALDIDPVATQVFEAVEERYALRETSMTVDGFPVLQYTDGAGHTYLHVRLHQVLSHDYGRYLPVLHRHFAGADVAGVVNWHEGDRAPAAIFCAHTTGDVASGSFGPADPKTLRALFLALETHRKDAGLAHFRTLVEATHWSGIPYGSAPAELTRYQVPLVDIEIGSEPESWSSPQAAHVMARALHDVFQEEGHPPKSVLCGGGVHFEPAFTDAVLGAPRHPLAVSHVLPNQWLVAGDYAAPAGVDKLQACIESIQGGIDVIAVHDKLKGGYKDAFRRVGEQLGIPIVKHRRLRTPEALPIWEGEVG